MRNVYTTGLLLKELNKSFPEVIEEIVTQQDTLQTKMLLSDDAKMELERGAILRLSLSLDGELSQIESELIANWLLAVFDAVFDPVTPTNLIDVFNELPNSEQDQLNNEFPADRERILRQKFRKNYLTNSQ